MLSLFESKVSFDFTEKFSASFKAMKKRGLMSEVAFMVLRVELTSLTASYRVVNTEATTLGSIDSIIREKKEVLLSFAKFGQNCQR